MRYLSVCSGIEAATVAWHHLGWQPVAFSDIEPFTNAVLEHHYPNVPNWGDMTNYKEWPNEQVDLLVGGTPCQSFSVAGLRKGLSDPRGNLALTFCGIIDKYKPKWVVWENVPGVLSSHGGRDFGAFLGALGELGYGWAYRVLDAQYFGVAQRRRRVFVVGCLGDWASAAAVLFERESLRRDTAPSRKARKDITECAGTLTANGGGLNRPAGNANELDFCVTVEPPKTKTFTPASHGAYREGVGTLRAHGGDLGGGSESLVTQPYQVANTLTARMHKGMNSDCNEGQTPVVQQRAVRRLTPVECERLQGFPDNYTRIAWRKKQPEDCPDGPRYKALGNSMAVPVMRWIGSRINSKEIIE